MPKVLLAAWGSAGDVAPLIGIELSKRGHDVTVLAMPVFESAVTDVGLSFVEVGSASVYRQLANPDFWTIGKPVGPEVADFMRTELPRIRVDQYFEAIANLSQPGRTVIVAHPRASGARLAHERLGMPLALVEFSPCGLPSRFDPPHPPWPLPRWIKRSNLARRATYRGLRVQRALARRVVGPRYPAELVGAAVEERVRGLRTRLGPITPGAHDRAARSLNIGAWPDWFAPLQPDQPRNTVLVGFVFQGLGGPAAPPAGRGSDRASRPLVFTVGSIAGDQHEFFSAAVEACRILDRPGVLVTRYRGQLPRALPPRVTHVEFAPFPELFAGAAAVVHHGGIGTVALALAAGIPQVVKPMNWDQFDNAFRMERLGVGRMIDARGLEPNRLARTLDSVLSSSDVHARCAYWSRRVDRREGLVRSADVIDGMLEPAED